MFRTLNQLTNKGNKSLPDSDDHCELANNFCQFFKDKVKNIQRIIDDRSSNISSPTDSSTTSAADQVQTCTLSEFCEVTEDELLKIIMNCPTKSCALDPMPTWLLKQHIPTVIPSLTKIVNTSITTGSFPSSLGTASITPILKKSTLDKNQLKNYRPVSNIRFLGKLIEKVVSSQLTSYIDNNQLAEPLQSAYKAKHGTETALVRVHNDILREVDNQKAVFLVLLDLSAAFDTLDYKIMLKRFEDLYGITGMALKWFASYFDSRRYHVSINGTNSDDTQLDEGAPQGSVIGPLSFSMYTRPIGDILRKHNVQFHLYADDVQIYMSCNPDIPEEVATTLSKLASCVKDTQSWMLQNKLKLNQDKTEFLVVSSPHHYRKLTDVTLHLDEETAIRPSSSVRNLGAIFDKHLDMTDHITSVSKSVNFHLRNLHQIRKYIDHDTCHSAVRALITSRLDYCNGLLNGITDKNLHRLQLLQNKAARLIYQKPKYTHTSPLLNELHWLPIAQRIKFKTLTLTHKTLHDAAPSYLSDLLDTRSTPYNLRSSNRPTLRIPRSKKSAGDRSFSIAAPKLWNALPTSLANTASTTTFKKHLKTHLFV